MAFIVPWRNFKRMQDLTVVGAVLIYVATALDALQRLPGGIVALAPWVVAWPVFYMLAAFGVPLAVPAAKRWLGRYVWMSYKAGFGQTAVSVAVGVATLGGAAAFIHWQVGQAASSGQVGVNVFSAFGAGVGIMAAQAVLVRALERLPDVQAEILER